MEQVFISFKNSLEDGSPTEDSQIAQKLYTNLIKNNISTFFSNVTLLEFGEAAYKDAIENALDSASILVVIATKPSYLTSRWIKYEWSSFHEEILSGNKPNGIIIPYLHSSITRSDKPLALRNFETFLIDDNNIDKLVEFIIATINKKKENNLSKMEEVVKHNPVEQRNSTYSPSAHEEHSRLKIQAANTRAADMPALDYVFKEFGDRQVNVLDVGCAYGYVCIDRFSFFPNSYVYGIDRDQKCIDFAEKNKPNDHFHFAQMDLESDAFIENLQSYMMKNGIESFNLITATLVIHHLKDPNKFLRNIRRFLSNDGFIIIRGSDDGSVIAYNDNGLVKKVIDKMLETPGISDRLNGRKIYHQLYTTGYQHIKMFNYVKQIADLDFDEREDIFTERFLYRRNYLVNLLAKDPSNMEYKRQLEWMDYALGELQNLFGDNSFWYQEIDFVGVARKK